MMNIYPIKRATENLELLRQIPCWISVLMVALSFATIVHAAGEISQAELLERIGDGRAPLILDVRTPEEFTQGHVPGAINIPVTELSSRSVELGVVKESEIVVYCQMGPRADFASRILAQAGFSRVRRLDGHMGQWLESGHPVRTAP